MMKDKALNRITLLRNQLSTKGENINYVPQKTSLNKWRKRSNFDKQLLEELYFPYHRELRDQIFRIMCNNPEFKHFYMTDMTRDEIRLLTVKQIKKLVNELKKTTPFKEIRADLKKMVTFIDSVCSFDMGLSVKFGVHSVLYYNSLKYLSTTQHQIYMERAVQFEDIGCFGLTEMGHGSNVRDIKTTATYDETNQEFVLNSPDFGAYKWWIGGAGKTANMSVIFAQLYVKGVCHGVHCFLVPLRNRSDNMPYPGVILGDNGPKVGCENIDNGFIGFHNYRIPREGLLNKLSNVSEDGIFSSPISNPDIRFATVLGALEEGRVTIAFASQNNLRNAICIAGRFAALRKQFGREENEEVAILNYPLTQYRLIVPLAEHLGYRFAAYDLIQRWSDIIPHISDPKNELVKEVHAILSCLKPLSTYHAQSNIQSCREIMGGHGYSRLNMIGHYRNNNDINITWEGENSVLIQQTAKFIVDFFKKKMKGKNITLGTLKFMDSFDKLTEEKLSINEPKDLYNTETLQKFLEYRTNLLLSKTVAKLTSGLGDKTKMFDLWNNTQLFYLNSLAKSYGELYVFNCFKDKISHIKKSPTKEMLTQLLVLSALNQIQRDLAYFRENDFIMTEACDLIRDEIQVICDKLKDQFISIIDVIAPPDQVLGAPMGASNGNIFDNYLSHVFNSKACFERPEWWEVIHHKSDK